MLEVGDVVLVGIDLLSGRGKQVRRVEMRGGNWLRWW